MNEDNTLFTDESVSVSDEPVEVPESTSEDSQMVNDSSSMSSSEEQSDEDLTSLEEDSQQTEKTVEETLSDESEKSSSSVYQIVETDDGLSTVGLDVEAVNEMANTYNELASLQTVTPTSNDYYTFISGDVLEYFSDVMALYPMNEYRACHLRHWISNTSYSSYYDDYYYLWYDFGDTLDYIEMIKYNNRSDYVVNHGNGALLNATIMYGSDTGLADFRKGVSYVQEMALLCSIGVVLVLYILHAIFKHLAR